MNDIKACRIMNDVDDAGNPTGGSCIGTGLRIEWQNGPLGRDADRREPNGAFIETVISAALQRIEFYQMAANGKFACAENMIAATHLRVALYALDSRTKAREARQVEGTHTA